MQTAAALVVEGMGEWLGAIGVRRGSVGGTFRICVVVMVVVAIVVVDVIIVDAVHEVSRGSAGGRFLCGRGVRVEASSLFKGQWHRLVRWKLFLDVAKIIIIIIIIVKNAVHGHVVFQRRWDVTVVFARIDFHVRNG